MKTQAIGFLVLSVLASSCTDITSNPLQPEIEGGNEPPVMAVAASNMRAPGWSFVKGTDGNADRTSNKYRKFTVTSTAELPAHADHWLVIFVSDETFEGQPHQRGVGVKPNKANKVAGFWADVSYTVSARAYRHSNGNSVGPRRNVDRVTTNRCPSGTQHRDGLLTSRNPVISHPENPYRCEAVPEPKGTEGEAELDECIHRRCF